VILDLIRIRKPKGDQIQDKIMDEKPITYCPCIVPTGDGLLTAARDHSPDTVANSKRRETKRKLADVVLNIEAELQKAGTTTDCNVSSIVGDGNECITISRCSMA
jgi:hypothetical protein